MKSGVKTHITQEPTAVGAGSSAIAVHATSRRWLSFLWATTPHDMLKLYKFTNDLKSYWETWDNDGVHTIHWGTLGTRGSSRELKSSFFKKATTEIQKEIDQRVAEGFRPVEDHATLLIEFAVDGMGSGPDVEKRHRLEERMGETLGWTGLGHCDGGSIGSGTMEVCCLVVDFDTAKRVIEADLKDTEFSNYTRIYCEDDVA